MFFYIFLALCLLFCAINAQLLICWAQPLLSTACWPKHRSPEAKIFEASDKRKIIVAAGRQLGVLEKNRCGGRGVDGLEKRKSIQGRRGDFRAELKVFIFGGWQVFAAGNNMCMP